MRVPRLSPPPTQSLRLKPPLPGALLEWTDWASEGFFADASLCLEAMKRLEVGDLVQLFAHLEPVPSQLWVAAVQVCLGGSKELLIEENTAGRSDDLQYRFPGASPEAIRLAGESWLAGYRQLRQLHANEDRKVSKQDRRAETGLHPALWRKSEWAIRAEEFRSAAQGVEPIKAHKRGVVTRIPNDDGGHLILKHFPPHKKIDPRNSLGFSKAISSLHASEALNRRGLRAAYGYAAWSEAGQGSWMLMEDLAEHRPLQFWVMELQGSERAKLLADLAKFTRRMHLLGVAYRDFKPSNILVHKKPSGEIEFAVIDHDRNRFRNHEIPPSKARRDLAALHAGLPPRVRATERLKALRIYGGPWRQHPCNWGYRGSLWSQQIPKLIEEAIRRDRIWKSHYLLAGHPSAFS